MVKKDDDFAKEKLPCLRSWLFSKLNIYFKTKHPPMRAPFFQIKMLQTQHTATGPHGQNNTL